MGRCKETPIDKCGTIFKNTDGEFACEKINWDGNGYDCDLKRVVEASDPSDGVGGYVALAVGGVLACLGITWCCQHKPKGDNLDSQDDIEKQRQEYPENCDRRRLCH